uniref:ABC transporter permease n=1 Tax=Agathobacter sp. TaxID=2021311 RepID=UPI004057B2AF
METIIGEEGSQYSEEMMLTYFGMSEMNYEEACVEYDQTMKKDKVSNGFARLFCDYMGLILGLYPVFIVVIIWLKDSQNNEAEVIYSHKVSSMKLVLSRYLASITMILLPVILLSFESLIPLMSFGEKYEVTVDVFAYIRYIFWWLLPTVMMVSAIGTIFTLLTDSPIAVVLQFLWWMVDKGITGLLGDTKLTTLMVRHNTLQGYEIIKEGFEMICVNRLLIAGIAILIILLSVWILEQKRKGRINATNIYQKCMGNFKNKFSFSHTK